jgi:hypothetical protein
MRKALKTKFKTYKSDAAPFFFFIDIYPPDTSYFSNPRLAHLINSIKGNPVMPLPMRVDRVSNGQASILIRPNEPVSFPINENLTALINPYSFLQFGIEKLVCFTEVRSSESLMRSLSEPNIYQWWNLTKNLYAKLYRLEEDFSAFLRAYLNTMIKAKVNDEDLINAANIYCQSISDICQKRMMDNSILTEINGKQKNVRLYKTKEKKYYKKLKKVEETQHHPELIDIEVFDLSEIGFSQNTHKHKSILDELESYIIKYIPLLFYDDLQECMLQNLKRLQNDHENLIDPSILIEQNIILLKEKEQAHNNLHKFSWLDNFFDIDLESILHSIKTSNNEFYKSNSEN